MGDTVSDPLVWNGTRWARPSFWDGSSWAEYLDPVHDIPMSFPFTSGPEGFTVTGQYAGGWNPGGWMECGSATVFLYGYASVRLSDPDYAYPRNFYPAQGHAIELRATTRVRPGTRSDPVASYFDCNMGPGYPYGGISYSGQNSDDEFSQPADSQWRTWTQAVGTLPTGVPKDTPWEIGIAAITIRSSQLGGTEQIGHYMDVDSFVLWDVTAGQPLMDLSAPGWEPRVWTGAKWL